MAIVEQAGPDGLVYPEWPKFSLDQALPCHVDAQQVTKHGRRTGDIEQGIPQADILVETESHTTRENLYYAQRVAAQHDLRTLLLVSDPLHMKRAMLIAQDLGIKAHPSPTPTTMYRSRASQVTFLARETRLYLTYVLRRHFLQPPPHLANPGFA